MLHGGRAHQTVQVAMPKSGMRQPEWLSDASTDSNVILTSSDEDGILTVARRHGEVLEWGVSSKAQYRRLNALLAPVLLDPRNAV